jgi:hypothetical protein
MSLNVGGGKAWTAEGLTFNRFVNANSYVQLRNYWGFEGGYERSFEVLDDVDTRGGPPIVRPASNGVYFGVLSDSRRTWQFNMWGNAREDAAGGWNFRLSPGINLQPSGRFLASISTSYNFGRDIAQWIQNVDSTGDGILDYVYGTLDRDVVDVTFRSTYSIHRDLTVQMFLQPFVAAGKYDDIRRLAQPSSFVFEPTGLETSPDFNNKSLRGNIVLRWEYLRGSTLFVAWNMATSDTSRPGTFSAARDLRDGFGASGTHALLIKVSHWLNR